MIRAIVHQGFVGKTIEYFAVVAGPDVDRRFFFELIGTGRGDVVRYFGGNSEIVLNPEGVRFRGNGGIFGEYMFGGHLPVGDLLNEEVVNRLVMFGATTDSRTHELRFTTNDSPEVVTRWYRDPARASDFTVAGAGREGRDFLISGTAKDEGGDFRVRLSPNSAGGTEGRVLLSNRD